MIAALAAPNKDFNTSFATASDYYARTLAGLGIGLKGLWVIATGAENRGTGPQGSMTFAECVAATGDPNTPGLTTDDKCFINSQLIYPGIDPANMFTVAGQLKILQDPNLKANEVLSRFLADCLASKDQKVGELEAAFGKVVIGIPGVAQALAAFVQNPPAIPPGFIPREADPSTLKGEGDARAKPPIDWNKQSQP